MGFAARRAREEHELDLEASMEMTLALTTGPENLQQLVRSAVVLRGRVGNQRIPAPRRPSLRNHDVSGAGVDRSVLSLAHPRLLAQLLVWPVDEVKRSSL